MTEPEPVPSAPPTVEVVAMKVAEQLMTDMYRRIAELEARLALVEREADEAEQVAAAAHVQGAAFTEVAQQLLRRADEMRTSAGRLADAAAEPDAAGDRRVIQLPTTSPTPRQDEHG